MNELSLILRVTADQYFQVCESLINDSWLTDKVVSYLGNDLHESYKMDQQIGRAVDIAATVTI